VTDEIDLANERAEIERSVALSRHAARKRGPGLDRCAICDEPIGDYRKALGGIHCVQHAEELEQRRGLR